MHGGPWKQQRWIRPSTSWLALELDRARFCWPQVVDAIYHLLHIQTVCLTQKALLLRKKLFVGAKFFTSAMT